MIFQAKNIHYTTYVISHILIYEKTVTFVDTLPALFLKESRRVKSSNILAESCYCQAKTETKVTESDVILEKQLE